MPMYKPKIILPITWRQTLPFNSKSWQYVWKGLLHFFFPNTCYSCKRDLGWQEEDPLCPSCQHNLKPIGSLYCLRCGKPLPDGGAHCYDCRGYKAKQYACKVIRSAWVFNEVLRPVIHAFKYEDQPYLAAFLGSLMHQQWSRYPELSSVQLLIPVPLYPKKQKQRGYNQSALLAQQLGKLQQVPVNICGLTRRRNTPSQTQLGREERMKNMQGAFVCLQPDQVRGKIILLIDDVATTGATLEACAHALRKAGAKKVMAYTLAREI